LLASVAATDLRMAEDALRRATGAPPFDAAIQAARRVVELEAARIMRIADELCRRGGELDYDACRRIVTARR
jgi:hypothetical protein